MKNTSSNSDDEYPQYNLGDYNFEIDIDEDS
jgi:hypothetical protein